MNLAWEYHGKWQLNVIITIKITRFFFDILLRRGFFVNLRRSIIWKMTIEYDYKN